MNEFLGNILILYDKANNTNSLKYDVNNQQRATRVGDVGPTSCLAKRYVL
jgi:hypothetical protein